MRLRALPTVLTHFFGGQAVSFAAEVPEGDVPFVPRLALHPRQARGVRDCIAAAASDDGWARTGTTGEGGEGVG